MGALVNDIEVRAATLEPEAGGAESEAAMAAKFDRLLKANRSSAEFEALWREIDAWLGRQIQQGQRSA